MQRKSGTARTAFARAWRAVSAAGLPGVEKSTSYGTEALKVKGKLIMRVLDADTLVVRCPLEEKELLMAAMPEVYFETDHYGGWPAVLVRLSHIGTIELRHCLTRAWRHQAPKKLLQAFDSGAPKPAGGPRSKRARSRRRPSS